MIEKNGYAYTAKIISVLDKKPQAEVGQKIMWDLVFDTKNAEWTEGQIQMPDMGHAADVFIEFKDKDVIIVTGYYGLRLFGKSHTLLRTTVY